MVAVLTLSTVVEEAGEADSATSRLCKEVSSTTIIEDVKLGEKERTKLRGREWSWGRHHCRRLVSRRRKGGVMVATSS